MRKKRIIAFLKGGLGNQCFIYAAAKTLADRTGAQLCFSLDYFPATRSIVGITILDASRSVERSCR